MIEHHIAVSRDVPYLFIRHIFFSHTSPVAAAETEGRDANEGIVEQRWTNCLNLMALALSWCSETR